MQGMRDATDTGHTWWMTLRASKEKKVGEAGGGREENRGNAECDLRVLEEKASPLCADDGAADGDVSVAMAELSGRVCGVFRDGGGKGELFLGAVAGYGLVHRPGRLPGAPDKEIRLGVWICLQPCR